MIKIFIRRNKAKGSENQHDKILFLTYINHLDFKNNRIFRLNNLVHKIKNDQKIDDFILTATPFQIREYKKVAKCKNTLYEYIDSDIRKKSSILAKRLAKKWKEIPESEKYKSLKIERVSLWPYFKDHLNFLFSETFLYYTILYYNTFKKILIKEKIKCIVGTSSTGIFERIALAAGAEVKVPSVVIQHGVCLAISEHYLVKDPYNLNYIVNSEAAMKRLIDLKVSEKNIFVTGPIIFDDIYKYTRIKPKKRNRIMITVITSPLVEDKLMPKEEYFDFMDEFINSFKDIDADIIFKLHPREKYLKEYKKIIKSNGCKNIRINKSIDPDYVYNLMKDSGLVLTFGSTMVLEAMILKKPVVIFYISKIRKDYIKTYRYDGIIAVDYPWNIKEIIEKTLKSSKNLREKAKECISEHCYRIDGKAYERAVDIIYKVSSIDQT